jgi:hypothetical protein
MSLAIFRRKLTATLSGGTWTQAAAVERPPGLSTLSAQVVIESPDLQGATLTVSLQGTNVAPDADDAQWSSIAETELSGAERMGWLAVDRIIFVEPYRYLRLFGAHAGGSPAVSVLLYLDGDQTTD